MSTRANIVANMLGRVWAALMSFAFVPLYIRFMGIEAYGLIGFFASMLAAFFVLDMGLSVTLNRELARLESSPDDRGTARTLVRTMEIVYWLVGVAIALTVLILAPIIVQRWLNLQTLRPAEAVRAVQLMGITALFRWPVSLYSGALMGLRRQVPLNLVMSGGATVQGVGAVLILWLVSSSVTAFFLWQAVAAFLQILTLALVTWRYLKKQGHQARFAKAALLSIAGFSVGITGITLLSAILTQLDKFLLSRLVPLDEFGYYTLAGAIAAMLSTAAGAVYNAVFPVFASLVSANRLEDLCAFYHKSCQLLSVLLIPAAVFVGFFSRELLTVYIHDPKVVENTFRLLTLQISGSCFLALMLAPVGLQLAFGWVSLSLYKNVVAVALFVPTLIYMVDRFGTIGAAVTWNMLTIGYFLVEIQIMHRRLLRNEQWRWYFIDVGIPAAVSIVIATLARLIITPEMPLIETLATITVAGALALSLSALSLPATREPLFALARALCAHIFITKKGMGAG